MGWVAGPRLVAGTAEAGGLGILASATMTFDELVAAIAETKGRTDKPFGVNLRADADDASDRVDLLIREGVKVASFALAPKKEFIERPQGRGQRRHPVRSVQREAREEGRRMWGADAVIVQGGEGGGHTGAVATSLLLPSVPSSTPSTSRSSRPADSSTDAGWPPRCPTVPKVSRWALGSCSRRSRPCLIR